MKFETSYEVSNVSLGGALASVTLKQSMALVVFSDVSFSQLFLPSIHMHLLGIPVPLYNDGAFLE